MQLRERLIIENELKLIPNDPEQLKDAYRWLKERYEITPYKTVLLYDDYYDTVDHVLAKSGITYRLRRRPQLSINTKVPTQRAKGIWSRYEYSSKIDDPTVKIESPLNIACKATNVARKVAGHRWREMNKVLSMASFRIEVSVFLPEKNVLRERELVGVAFFDTVRRFDESSGKWMEPDYVYEMEAFEQSDVIASPFIFEEFARIQEGLLKLGFSETCKGKAERYLV